jgi:hypothetical protein
MATVRELVKGSMRLIGVIAAGETPSAGEMADGLSALNEMIDSWSNESLVIYTRVREEFSLVAGTQSYTIGTAGTFNTSRPVKIDLATIELQSSSPNIELPLEIINLSQWAGIIDKSTSSDVPSKLFIEGTYPLDTLHLWPKPSAANKVVLYSMKALTAFATADTAVSLPNGYLRALRYNLAIEMAPEFGREPSALVVTAAQESKEVIKRMNIKPGLLAANDLTSRKPYNILIGE